MISDTILHKYLRHLRYMGGYINLDAVELALRLALDELEQSIPSTPSTPSTELVALQANQLADLQAELERLQTAADAEVAELRQQIAQMDADNAAMIRRNRELVAALDIATGAAPAVAKPVAILTNGTINGTAITTAPPAAIHHTTLNDFASANLTPENYDWWIGLDAGRHTWRNLPKRNRLDLVRYVLSFGPPNAAMKMVEFDVIRPEWMPTAGTHTKTFNMTWEQLNDFTVELEATR